MSPKSHLFYQTRARRPMLDRAGGVHMWNVDAKRYLDGSSGAMVSNIGHSNARVLAAMRAQMEKATFGYRLHFESEPGEMLAAKVAGLSPAGMEKVFFVSGGSEAVESAIKLARQYAVTVRQGGRWKVISRAPSYHGSTLGALALKGCAPLSDPSAPMMQAMPKIPAPRADFDGLDMNNPATGQHYAAMLEAMIIAEGPETVLAFIQEPIGGASTGALVPPAGYMQAVREICARYDVLLIHDEVMSGGGRTGRFYGAAHWGVDPDIIAISKGFGAGYAPLGAMIAHEKFVEPVLDAGGLMHGHTYAGNPLACAAGLAVLNLIEEDGLMANAARIGGLLKSRLNALMQRFPFIGDVRGEGLLLAFELVADRATMRPLPKAMNAYVELVELAYAPWQALLPKFTALTEACSEMCRRNMGVMNFTLYPMLAKCNEWLRHFADRSLIQTLIFIQLMLGGRAAEHQQRKQTAGKRVGESYRFSMPTPRGQQMALVAMPAEQVTKTSGLFERLGRSLATPDEVCAIPGLTCRTKVEF